MGRIKIFEELNEVQFFNRKYDKYYKLFKSTFNKKIADKLATNLANLELVTEMSRLRLRGF